MATEQIVTKANSEQKLFNYLKRHFIAENNEIHRWIRTGQVRINKKRAKAFDIVKEGDAIRIPPFAMPITQNTNAPSQKTFPFPLIFENEHIVVINKPKGIACQGGTGQQENIADILKAFYHNADFVPAPAHRLDKDTSGLLLIGKSYNALRFLTDFMKGDESTLLQDIQKAPKKIYRAWVYGNMQEYLQNSPNYLCHYLYHNEEQQKEEAVVSCRVENTSDIEKLIQTKGTSITYASKKARLAISYVTCIDVRNQKSLVEIGIYTGRKHQIRVQLAKIGFALVGDKKYAPKKMLNEKDRFFLEAYKLSLPENTYSPITTFCLNNKNL